ncbi:unnamed protein product, partial [Brassica rapa]
MKLDTSGFETSMPTIGFGSSNDMLDGVMVAADSRASMGG